MQARGHRLEDGVEVVALKPCALRIVEGEWVWVGGGELVAQSSWVS